MDEWLYWETSDFKYFYIFSVDLVMFTRSEFSVVLTGRKGSGCQESKTSESLSNRNVIPSKYSAHHSLYLVSLCLASRLPFSAEVKEGGTGTVHIHRVTEGAGGETPPIRISSSLPLPLLH